jgi:hypothetical protein
MTNSKLAGQNFEIIDIGYKTLDLARIDSLDFINSRSTSFSGVGIFAAFQNLAAEIYRHLGVEIAAEQIENTYNAGIMIV